MTTGSLGKQINPNPNPKNNLKILALDLASKVGWAVSPGVDSGICDIKPRPNQKPGTRYQRLRNLLNKTLIAHPDIKLVFCERALPMHKASSAARYAFGCMALVELWCADKNLVIRTAHNMTVKKFLTGKGNADKTEMIAAIRARGFEPLDDNHADALAIMLYASQGDLTNEQPAHLI